jgi:hypothetical protein
MIRPTLFSRRRLEVRVASLAISVLPARTLRSPTAGIGTELVAHREEIEGMRRSSTFERSPVPVSRANRRAHAHFAHFPREYLKPETRWRSGLDANSRYRFLNWQTKAFRRRLQHSDGVQIGRNRAFRKVARPGSQFARAGGVMMAYVRKVLGSVNRQSSPDDIQKHPVGCWRPLSHRRTWRRQGGWSGGRFRPFHRGPGGIIIEAWTWASVVCAAAAARFSGTL